jgi:hypothetical protein
VLLQVWLRRSPDATMELRARTACSCRRADRAAPLTAVPGVPGAGAPCAAAFEAAVRAVRPARPASKAAWRGMALSATGQLYGTLATRAGRTPQAGCVRGQG